MEKMTYARALNAVINGEPITAEVKEKLVALKASIEKKNSAEKKPTAQQTANASIQEAILSVMANEPNRLFSITELIKCVPACADLTNQRVSALVRQLKDTGKVERVEEKRKAYFRYSAE